MIVFLGHSRIHCPTCTPGILNFHFVSRVFCACFRNLPVVNHCAALPVLAS